jgi:L,D-transpeptidase ErfK/SrfK
MFSQVPVNTPVHIVDQPIKLGWLADTLFVEVHPPLEEDTQRRADLLRSALELVFAEQERRPFVLNGSALKKAVEQHLGIPVPVSRPAIGDDERAVGTGMGKISG